jgi:hypothetical protein
MNYRHLRIVFRALIIFLLPVNDSISQSLHITGSFAEQLWQANESSWEIALMDALMIDQQALDQYLDYNQPVLFADKSDFFKNVFKGTINTDNATDFFDSMSEKYILLYTSYQRASNLISMRPNTPPKIQGACNPACTNINFQNGTLSSWDAFYGVASSTAATPTITGLTGGTCGSVTQAGGPFGNTGGTYMVSLLTTPGVDPITGSYIPTKPPLGGNSVMVGVGPNY